MPALCGRGAIPLIAPTAHTSAEYRGPDSSKRDPFAYSLLAKGNMKKLLAVLLLALFLIPSVVLAYTRVRGYTRSNGRYVAPHYRSDRNSSRFDNYSSYGNTNPFTGKKGYRRY